MDLERLLHLDLAVHHAAATALIARLLHLLDHRAHADRLDLCAAAAATGALLHALLLVDHLARQAQRARRPLENLLERNLERVHHVLALFHARLLLPAPAPAKHVKDVCAAAAAAALLHCLQASLVVELALVVVGEDVLGLLDLLEELLVAALVGVVLRSHLFVRL